LHQVQESARLFILCSNQPDSEKISVKNKNINFARGKMIGPIISIATLFLCLGLLELTGYIWETKTAQGSLGWTLVGARRLKLERYGDDNQAYFKFKANENYN